MASQIALICCTIYVIYLLRLESNNREIKLSKTIWLPTIWILYCASKPIPYWFGSQIGADGDLSIVEGSPMDRSLLSMLIIAGLIVLFTRHRKLHNYFKENKWLLILFFYMLISIVWSDYPFVSFKRWIKAYGTIIMATIILTEISPQLAINSILKRTVIISIPFSLLLVKYFPSLGVSWGRWSGEPLWAGITTGKNSLGVICMLAILLMVWDWLDRKKKNESFKNLKRTICDGSIIFMSIWLLKGPGKSYSATSTLVLLIGIVSMIFLGIRKFKSKNIEIIAIFLIVFISGTYYIFDLLLGISPISVIAELMGRDPTLTGRTDGIWAPLFAVAMKNPVFGVGYGGYWIVPMQFDKFTVNEAHNGYLDMFIELGIFGLILFGRVLIEFLRKSADFYRASPEWGSFLLTFLMVSVIHNFTESSFVKSTALLWNILVFLMISCKIRMNAQDCDNTVDTQ